MKENNFEKFLSKWLPKRLNEKELRDVRKLYEEGMRTDTANLSLADHILNVLWIWTCIRFPPFVLKSEFIFLVLGTLAENPRAKHRPAKVVLLWVNRALDHLRGEGLIGISPYGHDLNDQVVQITPEGIEKATDVRAEVAEPGGVKGLSATKKEIKPQAAPRDGEKQNPAAQQGEADAYFTHIELAGQFRVNAEALRKRLDRWRMGHDGEWQEVSDRKPREPRYLYKKSAVLPLIERLKPSSETSGERPAK